MDEYLIDMGKLSRLTEKECQKLIRKAQKGCQASRNKVIEGNLKLVIAMSKKYSKYAPIEELVAEGNLGLFDAIRKFDDRRCTKFSIYACWWIKCRMRSLLKTAPYSGVITIPGYWVSLTLKDDTDPKILALKSRAKACLQAAKKARNRPIAIDEEVRQLVDASQLEPSVICEEQELDALICESSILSDRSKAILSMSICDGRTLEAIGEQLGVSKERVRQLRNIAVARLQKELLS